MFNENIKIIEKNSRLYPSRLLNIKNPPKRIYAIGNINLLSSEKIFAIVGARECTEYGRKCAFNFAYDLSEKNICIISGFALGIDTSSHLGALKNIGKTIAVIGSGFNNIYPYENEWLFYKIIKEGGCIISEHEPNEKVIMNNFPKRNRIISGIANGVLVVEAALNGGSMVTARLAKKQNKSIYAIPGNIDLVNSRGVNFLIQNGASLVTKAEQIVENLYKNEETNVNITDDRYIEIYNLITDTPKHINEISRLVNKNMAEVLSLLTLMEIEGLVEQTNTNVYIRKRLNVFKTQNRKNRRGFGV